MALNRKEKQQVIEQVSEQVSESISMVIAEYQGLTVSELSQLRNVARTTDVEVRVVKNTLARQAVADTQFSLVAEALTGQVLLGFSKSGPGDAAKVFKDFAKEHKQLKVVGISLGGDLLPASQLSAVASLPTYEEALATLMAVMQAPVTKFAQTLNAVPSKLVRTVEAVRQLKDAA